MSKHGPFIMLPYAVYDSPEFTKLKPIDIAVLLLLIRKHNGQTTAASASAFEKSSHAAIAAKQQHGERSITWKNSGSSPEPCSDISFPSTGGPMWPRDGSLTLSTNRIVRRKLFALARHSNETSGWYSGETSVESADGTLAKQQCPVLW